MPLSKKRDRERKRQFRLESKKVQPDIPLYNPSLHRSGDTVRVLRGKREVVVTIPILDADSNAIPDQVGHYYSSNLGRTMFIM